MAQTRVFSWRIDDNKYGYLYISENKTGADLITDRILDESKLSEISNVVSQWDVEEYERRFNILNDAINSKYGKTIPGDYSRYINGYANNYIVLTGLDGKDGTNGRDGWKDEEIIAKVKKAVKEEFDKSKTSLVSEADTIKDYVYGKCSATVETVKNEFKTYKNTIVAKNEELSQKLTAVTATLQTASQLFDLNGGEVTKENLKAAITKSNSAYSNVSVLSNRLNDQINVSSNLERRIGDVDSSLSVLSESVNDRLSSVEESIVVIDNKVKSISTKDNGQTTENDVVASKGIIQSVDDSENHVATTETIDNGDGTYSVNCNIGNENYSIKIFGFGKKLKIREQEEGLVLASNGFRYKDNSGSVISMIGGNILLSNSDGSGKIEIKKDGVFINGTKQ